MEYFPGIENSIGYLSGAQGKIFEAINSREMKEYEKDKARKISGDIDSLIKEIKGRGSLQKGWY